MPFSAIHIEHAPRPSLAVLPRRLSSEEANRLIRIAHRKSSSSTSSKDRNLRVFLGHSHIAETLKHEILSADDEPSTQHIETRPSLQRQQTIRWAAEAESYAQHSTEEDEALQFEDDGEEDFSALTLVRTPSRAAQPARAPV